MSPLGVERIDPADWTTWPDWLAGPPPVVEPQWLAGEPAESPPPEPAPVPVGGWVPSVAQDWLSPAPLLAPQAGPFWVRPPQPASHDAERHDLAPVPQAVDELGWSPEGYRSGLLAELRARIADRLPASVRAGRVAVSGRVVVSVLVVVLLAAAGLVLVSRQHQPVAQGVDPSGAAAPVTVTGPPGALRPAGPGGAAAQPVGTAEAGAAPGQAEPDGAALRPAGPAGAVRPAADLVVDVVGAVGAPGLVRVPPGSRVADALSAAGGALPGAQVSSLNLARTLLDGEQLRVPAAGEAAGPPAAAPAPMGAPGASAAAPVSLNSASAAQLETLPGVGPVLAQKIIDWRTTHGGFRDVEQLREVGGIGDAKLASLRDRVTVQ